jgi:hypothetical protein
MLVSRVQPAFNGASGNRLRDLNVRRVFKHVVVLVAGLTLGAPAAALATEAASSTYNKAGVEHNEHCIELTGASAVMRGVDGNPLQNEKGTVTAPAEPGSCGGKNALVVQGIEEVKAQKYSMYYVQAPSGSPGFVRQSELRSEPPVNGGYAAGNGVSAPMFPGEPYYVITPKPIDHAQCYLKQTTANKPGTACGENYEYAPYGVPAGGNPHYALMTWSWINVGKGGIGRAAVAEGSRFYPAEVKPIELTTYNSAGQPENGSVIARYGRISSGEKLLYGWMVTSHTYNGQCFNHMEYGGGGAPLSSMLCPSPPPPPPPTGQQNLLANASFLLTNTCTAPEGWFVMPPEGGTIGECTYENPSRSEQGVKYEEFNGSVSGASIYQNVAIAPQPGQNYTFSIWVRAPEGEPTGQINVFGMEGVTPRDIDYTKFTANGQWQLVSVPLTVTQPKENSIRVQVYETTPNKNIDLDGAQLLQNTLANASFLLTNTCTAPEGWFVMPPEGGTMGECTYENPSRSEQGVKYEEFNGSVSGASIYQEVGIAAQSGQNYTFSIWVRAPEGSPTGEVAVFGRENGTTRDMDYTTFTANGQWQLVSVPLTVTQPKENSIRVQVYETTPNKNIDLDGAQLLQNKLANASFLLTNTCTAPEGWFVMPPEGGTMGECTYENPSRSEQGVKYEEFNGSVSGASIGQNVAVAAQPGQDYTFSIWVRAPEGEPTGQINVFGMEAGVTRDVDYTKFTASGQWQLVSVPLAVNWPKEDTIRVQAYETTPNKNIDLDGAQLH